MILRAALLLTLVLAIPASSTGMPRYQDDPLDLAQTTIGEVCIPRGISPYLMYALALVESRKIWADGLYRPWPYALNVQGQDYFPNSREEAVSILKRHLATTDMIDVGPFQINLHHNGHRVSRPEDLFDTKIAARVAADILQEAMGSTNDPIVGVGRYHSFTPERALNYGRKVLGLAVRLQFETDPILDR